MGIVKGIVCNSCPGSKIEETPAFQWEIRACRLSRSSRSSRVRGLACSHGGVVTFNDYILTRLKDKTSSCMARTFFNV